MKEMRNKRSKKWNSNNRKKNTKKKRRRRKGKKLKRKKCNRAETFPIDFTDRALEATHEN